MADDYKFQVSGDIGNAMFVLRGNTVAEVKAQAEALATDVDAIYEALNNVKQVAMVKDAFSERKGGGGYNKGGGGGYSKPAPAASQTGTTPDGTPTCAHGTMKKYDFTNSEGKQFKGHNCPLPKGTEGRCKAVQG